MLWSKQYYYFDGYQWLEGHHALPLRAGSGQSRNRDWFHMINDDILSMPDKWEYPWYAAWDLAFHTLALSAVDLDFAKEQLKLVLGGRYLHPNGQVVRDGSLNARKSIIQPTDFTPRKRFTTRSSLPEQPNSMRAYTALIRIHLVLGHLVALHLADNRLEARTLFESMWMKLKPYRHTRRWARRFTNVLAPSSKWTAR